MLFHRLAELLVPALLNIVYCCIQPETAYNYMVMQTEH